MVGRLEGGCPVVSKSRLKMGVTLGPRMPSIRSDLPSVTRREGRQGGRQGGTSCL